MRAMSNTHTTKQIHWKYLCTFIIGIGILLLMLPTTSYASKDVRLALLIANQQGWAKDPRLNYAVKGDLLPMSRSLRRLGFRIHKTLINQNPASVRRAFRSVLKRLRQKPRVTTFFFYYSGHADRNYFHMGARRSKPLSYKEFANFLNQVQVQRRFAVIDACFSGEIIRQFGSLRHYRNLRQNKAILAKGVERQLAETDLRKHFANQGEQVQGLQILSSSRFLSYESRNRKGSVFTYHFLRGLRGRADLDRDGKISMNELFLYVKPRVLKETGQSPQQWLFRIGGETYGFAPVYKSTLVIQSNILGRLQVAVDNFVWRWSKQTRQPIRLAVASGQGQIELRRGKRCWQQRLFFPSKGSVKLSPSQWQPIRCGNSLLVSKASLELPSTFQPPIPLEQTWSLELQGGAWGTTGFVKAGGDVMGLGRVGLRHRYFAILVGVGGTTVPFSEQSYTQLAMELRGEAGYRKTWGRFDLFAGMYLSVGVLLQDVNQDLSPALMGQVGITLSPAYWLNRRWALFLNLDAGVIPTIVRSQPRAFFSGTANMGLRYRFGD